MNRSLAAVAGTVAGLIAVHAAAAVPESGRVLVSHSRGLKIEASCPGPGIFRIAVQAADPATPGADADGLVSDDGSWMRVDRKTGLLSAGRKGDAQSAPVWAGSITPLNAFGRSATPGLAVVWQASNDEVIWGLGERFDNLNQNGRRVDMWLVDEPGQGRDGHHTYYVTPVLYSTKGYGMFADDNPEAVFDLNSTGDGFHRYHRAGRSGVFYVVLADLPDKLIEKRAQIHGPYRTVPDWAWGPWISRNSYNKQSEAMEAIQGMLDRNIPVAAIVQEAWKGQNAKGDFNNFNRKGWPDVKGFLSFCRAHDIKNILWQVPILHPESPEYKIAAEKGYFVKKTDGTVSFRLNWLKGYANIDFTNPDAVKFWQDLMRPVLRMGIHGFKADDGEDIKPDDVFFDGRRGWQMHNEYSTLYGRALTELLDQEKIDGMLWARSGSLGNEKTPALWAGDQFATWAQMRSLLPAGLSSSVSGMPFWGHDIGGYIDNPSPELYIRWVQFGAFSPLMQYHGQLKREPWEFGDQAVTTYRKLAHIRMNLRPTLIDLGRQAAEKGLPIMRPMLLEFPNDIRFLHEETQYMLGPDLLVAPVVVEGVTGRKVKFPAGTWQHLLYPVAFDGPSEIEVPISLDTAPVFVRQGAKLSVELREGVELGTWSKDLPIRKLVFGPERALMRNLKVPLSLEGRGVSSKLSFDVLRGVENVVFRSHAEGAGGMVVPLEAKNGRIVLDMQDAFAQVETPITYAYHITCGDGAGGSNVLFEGVMKFRPSAR
jgi:alpha-D-xyloside xylohydrolase